VYYSETPPPVVAITQASEIDVEYTCYLYLPSVGPPDEFGCYGGNSNIDIVLNFDGYAEEISWSITDTTSDVYVDGGSAYDSDNNNNEVVESVTLCHNKCYDFDIQDSAGDGLCDPDNNCGEYGIFVNGEEVYSDEDGDFGSSNTVSFCLDGSGNVVEPECGDDSDFLWKDRANKDCNWVARKLMRGQNKCGKTAGGGQSGRVRDYCQETCNQC